MIGFSHHVYSARNMQSAMARCQFGARRPRCLRCEGSTVECADPLASDDFLRRATPHRAQTSGRAVALVVIVLTLAVAVAGALLLWRRARVPVVAREAPPKLGPLRAEPASPQLSVRIGEAVQFSVEAEGAQEYTWSVWGRPVSRDAAWSYIPGPEDAGPQLVKVTISGADGSRIRRIWDIDVQAPVAPELIDVRPTPGIIAIPAGEEARFSCAARIAGTRSSVPPGPLHFEWTVDDATVREDERPGSLGSSELVLPAMSPGVLRVVARVSEIDRVAALAEWTVVVAPPNLKLIRATAPKAIERNLADPLELAVRMEPADTPASYEWSVDGQVASRGTEGTFEFQASSVGTHRIIVTATAREQVVGKEAWVVQVIAPEPTAVATATVTEPPPPAPVAPTETAVASVPKTIPTSPPQTTPAATAESIPPPPTAPASVPPVPAPPPPTGALAEAEVRHWLGEYARAWSRKDVEALRGMGQVRNEEQAERLERYFASVDALEVEVHVRAVSIEGDRAQVEFERTDTLTDPSGKRRELRLPPLRKEIERGPSGLRFTSPG
jgi:hypothetical protein